MKILRFYTKECGPCKVLSQNIEQLVKNSTLVDHGHIPILPVDAKLDVVAKEKYGVTSVPTLIAMDSDGTIIDRIEGFTGAQDHIAWFNSVGDFLTKKKVEAEAAKKAAEESSDQGVEV